MGGGEGEKSNVGGMAGKKVGSGGKSRMGGGSLSIISISGVVGEGGGETYRGGISSKSGESCTGKGRGDERVSLRNLRGGEAAQMGPI